MIFLVIAVAGVAGVYALLNRKQGSPLLASENSNQVGSVSYGAVPGQVGGSGGPGTSAIIGTSTQLGAQGFGAAAGLGLVSKTGALAKDIPIAGALIGIGLTIYSMISAHHKQALAAEGKALNDATPRAIQTFVLIVQAVIAKEVKDKATAQALIDKTIGAYYGEVRPIQHGMWPYVGADMSLDYDKVWIKRTQVANPDAHAPNPCNGACVIGHFFVERGGKLAMLAVSDVLAGNHGAVTFPTVPPHETQQGYPSVTLTY